MFKVIDFETTGIVERDDPPDMPPHQVMEAAHTIVSRKGLNFEIGDQDQRFFEITRECTIGARATHHIPNEWTEGGLQQDQLNDYLHQGSPEYFVAHNADYELQFFDPKGVPVICTMKAAKWLYPDAKQHTNQFLRYYLGLNLPVKRCEPPHRALPDTFVTASILISLLTRASAEQMVAWTKQPAPIWKMTIGEHYGKPMSEVPLGFLQWAVRTIKDKPDLVHACREEIRRRAAGG